MTNLTNLIQPTDDETMARQRIEDSPLNSKGFQRTKSEEVIDASTNEHISPGY